MPKSEPLDVLLNASLRVSRPVAACSRCRGAKIKCDGKLPACTACERAGKGDSCSGANDDFAKGKERSYVAALESACERLQKRINNTNGGGGQSPSFHDFSNGIERHSEENAAVHAAATRRSTIGEKMLQREASEVDELVGDFGYLAVNATSRDFYGFSDTMSFPKLMLFSCQKQKFPQYADNLLPPKYAAMPLFQYYLDNIYTLFPFFSETNFMASVTAVYSDDGRFSRPFDHFILRMVLAISAASKSRRKDDQAADDALRHVSAAIEFAEAVINPGSITGIQAILLLAQYSLFDPVYLSCWDLIGVASRVMVDLGIHQEPAADLRLPKDQIEIRRRVFYSVFAFDRLISMSLSRAFSFTDESAIVELPAASRANSMNSSQVADSLFLRSLDPSYHLYKIRILQSQFYHIRNSASRNPLPAHIAWTEALQLATDAYTWFHQAQTALTPQQSRSSSLFFRLEMLYTQLLALSTILQIPDDNRHYHPLLANIATDYLLNLAPAMNNVDWYAFFTHTDILRVSYTAATLLNALQLSFDVILTEPLPLPTYDTQLPPTDLLHPASHDVLGNLSRVLSSLEAVSEILLWAEQRWGPCMRENRENFENESVTILTRLRAKQSQVFGQNATSAAQNPTITAIYQPTSAVQSIGPSYPIPSLTLNTQTYGPVQPQEAVQGYGYRTA